MNLRLWRAYVVVGVLAVAGYPHLPAGLARDVAYEAVGLSCVVAIAVGLRRYRPDRRRPWALMLIGQALWIIGDAIDSLRQDVLDEHSFPSLSDAAYLLAYPIIGLGLLAFIRARRRTRDPGGMLDSAILTAALGLLSWVFLARPTLEASAQSISAAVVGVAYPVADIVLVGLLVRLVTGSVGRTPAFRLLFLAVGFLIAGDTATTAFGLWTSTDPNSCDMLWLLSYVAWGGAALHPTMATLSEPSDGPEFTRKRLTALAAATLVAPGLLAAEQLSGRTIDVWPVIVGSVVSFGLVVARMSRSIHQIVAAEQERQLLQQDLRHRATHDDLTGLRNRPQAVRDLEAALNRSQRAELMVAVLFVDLDGFKAVNDLHGHAAGDEVLRTVGRRLPVAVRAGDLAARFGGDEFVVVLENVGSEANAAAIADRVLEAIRRPIVLASGHEVRVGASIGLSLGLDGTLDPAPLLHEADTAAYRAKTLGKNRVEIFDDGIRRELADRVELEAAIGRAIDQDELVVHYQPIVGLTTGGVSGYEALVRWQRPGHGLVPPADFIPTVELSPLICDLDTWVLRHAASQLVTWLAAGHPETTMSVNISGRHASLPRVVDDVRDALADTGLPARLLVLEITETVLIEPRAVHHLYLLRELGVGISIDDFGTGYNSVGRLTDFPVDTVKIDRSFLPTAQKPSIALLELIVRAAHEFGVAVVVEGVESDQQLDAVRSIGGDRVQGFYLGHPLPAEGTRPLSSLTALPAGGAERRTRQPHLPHRRREPRTVQPDHS